MVDWARSCHHGAWRLFADRPDVVTYGRFYFAEEDVTPYVEGPHNFLSADWTFDRGEPYEAPALGEDRTLRRGYSPGALGVPSPPSVILGTSDCLESGEAFYPSPERQLVAGVSAACWTQGGQVVPEQIPVLDWNAARFDPLAVGVRLALWPDESVSDNPGLAVTSQPTPVKSLYDGVSLVTLAPTGGSYAASFRLDFAGDFVLWAVTVALPSGAPIGRLLELSHFNAAPDFDWSVAAAQVSFSALGVARIQVIGNTFDGVPHVFGLRRKGYLLTFTVDGTNFIMAPLPSVQTVSFVQLGPFTVVGALSSIGGAYRLIAYPDGLSDAQFLSVRDALRAEYGTP